MPGTQSPCSAAKAVIMTRAAQTSFVVLLAVDGVVTESESRVNTTVLMGKMLKLKHYSSKDISSGSKAGLVSAGRRLGSAIAVPATTKFGKLRLKCFSDVLRASGGWPPSAHCFVYLSSIVSQLTLNASSSLSSFFS